MKATKSGAQYTPIAAKHSERCEVCEHFTSPDQCSKVAGKVSPKGWCRFFEKKK